MTIALGTHFVGGLIVCADTNVVADDSIVTSGSKVSARELGDRSYVIANAGNDGNAASMLAENILDALSRPSTDRWKIEPIIKQVMYEWHTSYFHGAAPPLSFVLAANTGLQSKKLYFCEPPSTVLKKELGEPVAIGAGGKIVDPLLPSVISGPVPMRVALLQVAYLMYRAKRDHILLRGSDTDAMIVATDGEVRPVSRDDMREAEELGPVIDRALQACFMGVLGQPPFTDVKGFLAAFRKIYQDCVDKCSAVRFRSVDL